MSQSHRIKGGGATGEAFQEQRFPRERGASVGVDHFNFHDLLHAR